MATNTYVALASVTAAGGGTSQLVMSSIPSGYTDLRLVISGITSTTGYAFTLQVNGDTGSNYSQTLISGNGSVAQSSRYSNATNSSMYLGGWVNGYDSTAPTTILVDFMNYSNSTTYKTILWRSSSATRNVEAGVMLWRGSTGSAAQAITSITVNAQSGSTISSGSTFTIYGIANADLVATKATGGIITEDATYTYHTFGSSGTFTPKQALTADILVVAGGGSGSSGQSGTYYGFGGGAGEVKYFASQSLASGTAYTCTVGAGGASIGNSTINVNGNAGSVSTFGALTSAIAGSGANYNSPGGSSGNGFTGGAGSPTAGGGGAGAGANGGAASGGNTPGVGGNGISTYSSWSSATSIGQNVSGTYYLAGGGGGVFTSTVAAGGYGGGGGGGTSITQLQRNGLVNTGSGGSGGGDTAGNSGAGGSGVVIIRYPK